MNKISFRDICLILPYIVLKTLYVKKLSKMALPLNVLKIHLIMK